nr:putative ribonuclease H-like domain-containing protein [Tanacetum cinerariifolium]
NADLNQFCGLKGIKREFSVPGTPQQNDNAERKNKTLIEAARTLLESLHVNFIENKPTVVAFGPVWLFDIDSLSHTMNYHPVLAENQSNTHAGFQDTEKAGEEGTQTYVLFLVLSDGSINPKNNNKDALVDGKEHDDDIQKSITNDFSAAGPSNAVMPNLEDLSHNADTVVSLIPTTRIHKDHPTSQIIDDLSSTTQTISMARAVRDQGGISQMFN